MPKLAIVDQHLSAGGVERLLLGLVNSLITHPEFNQWQASLILNWQNSGGHVVEWPKRFTAANIDVRFLRDDGIGRLFTKLSNAQRILGIPGTGRIQRLIPKLLGQFGPVWILKRAGDARLWVENFFDRQSFDLVHFNYPYTMDCPELSIPMVISIHDLYHKRCNDFQPHFSAQAERRLPRWLEQSKKIIVSSRFMAEELRFFYPQYAEKIRVVYPGISDCVNLPSRLEAEAYRVRWELPQEFLLVVGWIAQHKNQHVVLEALAKLRRKGSNLGVVFVGPNANLLQPSRRKQAMGYVKKLLETADRSGLICGRDFWALGYVKDFELECLYRLAKALIVPPIYEGGSFPVLEAMRAACPVICSRIPPLVEEVELVGGNAWLFDPYDPQELARVVMEVLSGSDQVKEKIDRAAQLVPQVFSWKRAASEYLSVFEEAIYGNSYTNDHSAGSEDRLPAAQSIL